MEQREYQTRIIDSIRNNIVKHDAVLVYAPTGAGKTKITQYIIERLMARGKKCLFTVPRIKLAVQTKASFGFGNLILGAKTEDENSLCTIASVQSLYARKITEHFDYIFIDECHFAHESEYITYIFETYSKSKIIGLSATPIDQNGYLLDRYQVLIQEVGVKDLIGQGFLTDVDVYASNKQPDFSKVDISDGDYNQVQASKILKEVQILTNTIDEWNRLARDLKTICFASSIDHAEELLLKFESIGIRACCVHSKMSEKSIDEAYFDFHRDHYQVLINVDMATFGFDEPSIKCMLFARGIKSLRLYKQMVGRGIRKFEGKDKCLMIDCANVILDNGYPTDEITFIKKPIINKTVDKLLGVKREIDGTISEDKISADRIETLQKIGSLVDLYRDKVYATEQLLLEDCREILKRAGFYMWRQNSGRLQDKKGNWVMFTDRNGLPDFTVIYKSVYIGLELKLLLVSYLLI